MPCVQICTWPGQFIGLIAYTRSSGVRVVYMFSPNVAQCPEASHRLRSISSGPLTSWKPAAVCLARMYWIRVEHLPALGMPEHRARRLLLHVEQVEFAANFAV